METITDFLIDMSGSMKEKLPITRDLLLNNIIPALDYSARIGLKTFTATKDKKPIIKTILPISITNKEQIFSSINVLPEPGGDTPIAESIKESINSLKEFPAYNKKIILVTDGGENCNGDFSSEISKAKSLGIECQIHIIGIGLKPEWEKQAKSISNLSNGTFSHISFDKGTVFNPEVAKAQLKTFLGAVSQTFTIKSQGTEKTPLESSKVDLSIKNNTNVVLIQATESIDNSSVVNNEETSSNKVENNVVQEEWMKKDDNEPFFFFEDNALNERIRNASEKYINEYLKRKYFTRVKWLNEVEETGSNHDFEIIDLDNSIEYYIECKGTIHKKPTFYLTKEEWRLFLNHTKNYQVYFVQNSLENPTHIHIDNLLDWILKGKVVPYLNEKQVIKEERVFLTIVPSFSGE
jgi:hypothetical protein